MAPPQQVPDSTRLALAQAQPLLASAVGNWLQKHGRMIRPRLTEVQFNELLDCFHLMDLDNSGAINVFELKEAFQLLGFHLTLKEVKVILQQVDSDGSGEVDVDEYITLMTNQLKSLAQDRQDQAGSQLPYELMSCAYRRKRYLDHLLNGKDPPATQPAVEDTKATPRSQLAPPLQLPTRISESVANTLRIGSVPGSPRRMPRMGQSLSGANSLPSTPRHPESSCTSHPSTADATEHNTEQARLWTVACESGLRASHRMTPRPPATTSVKRPTGHILDLESMPASPRRAPSLSSLEPPPITVPVPSTHQSQPTGQLHRSSSWQGKAGQHSSMQTHDSKVPWDALFAAALQPSSAATAGGMAAYMRNASVHSSGVLQQFRAAGGSTGNSSFRRSSSVPLTLGGAPGGVSGSIFRVPSFDWKKLTPATRMVASKVDTGTFVSPRSSLYQQPAAAASARSSAIHRTLTSKGWPARDV